MHTHPSIPSDCGDYAIDVDNAPSTPYPLAPCTPTPQFPVTVMTAVNSMAVKQRRLNLTLNNYAYSLIISTSFSSSQSNLNFLL